jgi:hypothetical protein
MIGLWLGDQAPGWPDVHDFVNPSDLGRDEVVAHLTKGTRTDRAYMGFSRCRLCGCENGSGELTDGVLIWPEGLAHYVRDHKVRLPADVEALLIEDSRADAATVQTAVEASNEERDWGEWWRTVTTAT